MMRMRDGEFGCAKIVHEEHIQLSVLKIIRSGVVF